MVKHLYKTTNWDENKINTNAEMRMYLKLAEDIVLINNCLDDAIKIGKLQITSFNVSLKIDKNDWLQNIPVAEIDLEQTMF